MVKTAALTSSEHKVGPIQNLVKNVSDGKCSVAFDLVVDGKLYHLANSYEGVLQEDALCYYAKENARNNLLLDLPGTFKTEAVTVCKEGQAVTPKIKIGDIILASEVKKHKLDKVFNYQGKRCQMFVDQYVVQNETQTYNGVMCQVPGSDTNWQIVDKW
jgi:hypothetical protein